MHFTNTDGLTWQVSIRLDGENKAVEYNAVGLTKDAVRAVFKNDGVDNLFDRNWHKIALSVEAKSVSLYLDCKHIQTLPIEDREDIDIQGKTVIGKRLYDSVPIDVSPQRIPSPANSPVACLKVTSGLFVLRAVWPSEDDDLLRFQARWAGDLLRSAQWTGESTLRWQTDGVNAAFMSLFSWNVDFIVVADKQKVACYRGEL